MQATKVKGIIDGMGKLVINEPINLTPGEVEVILLQSDRMESTSPLKPKRTVVCPIPSIKEWLEKTEPASPDFDYEEARWEALREKHNL